MTEYRIECLDLDGCTTQRLTVRCNDINEAYALAPTRDNDAVLICPLSAPVSASTAPRSAAAIN